MYFMQNHPSELVGEIRKNNLSHSQATGKNLLIHGAMWQLLITSTQ